MGERNGTVEIMHPLLLCAAVLGAQEPTDLSDLTLEELLRLQVTTASRKEQSLLDTPAAVSVIRDDDLRRMGVRSLPEALRMVPGANVSRIDANLWAISLRGFSDRFANKLQVLIDGRSVYSPSFSGVWWDQQDTFLEDVERIEVIRGPGGAVWGANAVNGVINVITRRAKATQGVVAFAGGGTEERAFGGLRYGGAAGDDVHYRAFVQGFDRDEMRDPVTDDPAHDDTWQGRAGFRADATASEVDEITILGEVFHGFSGATNVVPAPFPIFAEAGNEHYRNTGGHAILRWDRRLGGMSLLTVQASFTRTVFETSFVTETRDTFDVDLTHRFALLEGHDVVWGAGYRLTGYDFSNSFFLALDPAEAVDDVVSLFVQDEIELAEKTLSLTLGARAEYNDYTGVELQPSARLSLSPHERHQLWLAVSRAVRTPSRGEDTLRINVAVLPPPPAPPGLTDTQIRWVGSRHFESEELLAYEAGYRVLLNHAISVDAAIFYNDYDHFRSIEPRETFVEGTSLVVLSEFDNKFEARTYGAEIALTWQVTEGWRLYGAYTFLRENIDPDGDSLDTFNEVEEDQDAKGQAFVRSSHDLAERVKFDAMARYVGPIGGQRDVDAYAELDLRLAWSPRPFLELSVVGQNLLHDAHRESGPTGFNEMPSEIERGVYFMAVARF